MDERYLIIADDFTGANDTGVQLRRRGFSTEVLFCGKPLSADKCTVIDTESRTIPPEEAYQKVAGAMKNVDFAQYLHVIKKIDSTMRGNIAQEVLAVDEAFRPELIVFAPALPDLNRTTVGGVQFLNGVAICQTELARDPKNPVTEDSLLRIMAQAYTEEVCLKSIDDVRSEAFSFDGGRIFACDALTNEDLRRIIQTATACGKRTLYIGTAGIADNMMGLEHPTLPALGVVASVSSVINQQMRYCEKAGYTLVQLPMEKILAGEKTTGEFLKATLDSLEAGNDTILLTNTSYDRDLLALSFEAGKKLGMDNVETGNAVRAVVGKLAVDVLERAKVSGVFLSGGDTAQGIMLNIDADGSEILSEIQVGIPLVRVQGGKFDGLKVVTKAGAFGTENSVAFAMRKLKEPV